MRPADIQFLLDGVVAEAGHGDQPGSRVASITAPAALGFDEAFEGIPVRTGARAVELAVCLSIMTDHFLGLLSENTELAQGLFRMLLETHGSPAEGRVLRGVVEPPPAERIVDGLQPIERLLVLAAMPVFAQASTEQLAALGAVTREVTLTAGSVLFRESDAPAIYLVLAGELALEPATGGEPLSVGAGDCVGVYETLGGLDTSDWRAHVTRGGMALRVEREALFDVLADHIDLLRGMFSALRRPVARAMNV